MEYAKLIKGTMYLPSEYGEVEADTLFLNRGYVDTESMSIYINPGIIIGGIGMSRLARERIMFFGSWTGQPITENAVANIGDSTGVTGCTITAATFGAAVNDLSGEYVFTHDGTGWYLNGNPVSNISTAYGISVTGDAVENDIIVVTYTAAASAWEALGKDNDDLSKELNPDTETGKNVLGETTFKHSGYKPEVSIDPYYIDPSRKMYKHLAEVAIQEKYADADILGYFAEAHFTAANPNTRKMTGYAYVRQAYFVPQSVGGDTSNWAIPFTVTPVGSVVKKQIVYDMATNEATITDLA